MEHLALITILSLWTGWIVIVVILFEIIQYLYRKATAIMAANARVNDVNQEPVDRNIIPDIETGTNPIVKNRRLNKIKLIVFLIHVIISIAFSISFIIFIWN